MTKKKKLILVSLAVMVVGGCTFIVKDEDTTKYYGIDKQRGSEYLSQILDKQQQVYEAAKKPLSTGKP